MKSRRPPAATLLGLCVALLLPLLSNSIFARVLGVTSQRGLITVGLVIHWATVVVLVAIVTRAEHESLQSIGWRVPRWYTLPAGIAAGAIIAIVSGYLARDLGMRTDTRMLAILQSLPVATRVMVVVTAGVFEEIAYRGYGMERLSQYFGGRWVAAAATLVLFTFAHAASVGVEQLGPIAIVAALITALYLWRRDLLLNMVAHSTIDAIGLLLVPALA